MSEKVRVTLDLNPQIALLLSQIAAKNKRSRVAQIEWVLEDYVGVEAGEGGENFEVVNGKVQAKAGPKPGKRIDGIEV